MRHSTASEALGDRWLTDGPDLAAGWPGGHAALPAETVALRSLWRGHRLPLMDHPGAHRPGDLLIRLPLIPASS